MVFIIGNHFTGNVGRQYVIVAVAKGLASQSWALSSMLESVTVATQPFLIKSKYFV